MRRYTIHYTESRQLYKSIKIEILVILDPKCKVCDSKVNLDAKTGGVGESQKITNFGSKK